MSLKNLLCICVLLFCYAAQAQYIVIDNSGTHQVSTNPAYHMGALVVSNANGGVTLIDSNTITTGNSTNSGNIQTATFRATSTATVNGDLIVTAGNIIAPATFSIRFSGQGRISSPSDGMFNFRNGVDSDWASLTVKSISAVNTITPTNGLFLPQLSGIPTVDLRSSSGNTNWLALNLGGDVALIKTNPAAASSYLTNWLTGQLNFVEGSTAGTSVSLTTATAANITSVALTPGTWDLTASIYFDFVGATVTFIEGAFNTTSATIPGPPPEDVAAASPNVTVVSSDESLTIPRRRVTITANTTYYLVGRAAFSAGSIDAYGKILATRVN